MRAEFILDALLPPPPSPYERALGVEPPPGPLLKRLSLVFDKIFKSEYPPNWNKQVIHPIFKDGDEMSCNDYRGISVAPVLAKLYAMVLEGRITKWAEANGVRARSQAGFRAKFRTTDHIFTLQTLIDKAKAHSTTLYCCFVDFKKAFDSVPRELLWQRLREAGLHGTMLAALQSMYSNVQAQVATPQGLSASFPCDLGVKQGCPLSPLLFGMFIDRLEPLISAVDGSPPTLSSMQVPMLLYADDLLLISTSPQGLQTYLDTLHSFCDSSDLCVNLTKTHVVMFGKPPRGSQSWSFGGGAVPIKNEYKYLGLTFHCKRGVTRCEELLTAAGQRAVYALQQRCHELQLDVPATMCSLFDSLVRPVLSYGCEVWCMYPSPTRLRDKAEVLHRRFLKRCAGVADATPSDILYGEFGRSPLQVHWEDLASRYLKRLEAVDGLSILGCAYEESAALHAAGHPSWVGHAQQRAAAPSSWADAWRQRLDADGISSLIRTYSKFKSAFGIEPYLCVVGVPRQHRIALARLRMGSHWLGSRLGIYARSVEKQREKRIPCAHCSATKPFFDNPMLLCDGCDAGWHLLCLEGPHALPAVPDGSWFCPACAARDYVSPSALCAQRNRIETVENCSLCGQKETEWHALFSCGFYNSLRDEYQDVFPFENSVTLTSFFEQNMDNIPRLCEFVYKCYRRRLASAC
jgi:hypothetical protein